MPRVNIVRNIEINRTPRVLQLEGLFDVSPAKTSSETWNIHFEFPETWNVGVIVGPSGSGKTTVLNEIFSDCIIKKFKWSENKSVVDCFPKSMSIKDICKALSSVGFSSPPLWLRPFRVLSNGEQFRVTLARTLLEGETIVIDEFTSVVDRTVAKVGSFAVAKAVRRQKKKFVAATCHYDILEWLEPDWVLDMGTNEFHNGRYLQRPEIFIEVRKSSRKLWRMFRKYHYLNASIHQASQCFMATWDKRPVAFVAVLHFPHPNIKRCKREHRLVCLPDFQGAGIGNAVSNWVANYYKEQDFRYQSSTSNPAMIAYRNKSELWSMIRKPGFTRTNNIARQEKSWMGVSNRLTASFEFIGRS